MSNDGRLTTIGGILHDFRLQDAKNWHMPIYQYARPALTTDVVIFDVKQDNLDLPPEVSVLLIERGGEPFKGCLALPGGYVDIDKGETCRQAASRELEEETGLITLPEFLNEVGFFDDPNRNPAGRVVNMAYWTYNPLNGDLMRGREMKAGDDAVGIRWADITSVLDNEAKLAFDHKTIIHRAYNQLLRVL